MGSSHLALGYVRRLAFCPVAAYSNHNEGRAMTVVRLFVPCDLWTINRERKIHHYTRSALVQPIRQIAKLMTLNGIRNDGWEPIDKPVHVEFRPRQKPGVLADTANHLPPCKAVLDGIVDAGLLIDDTPEWVLSQRFWPPTKSKVTGIDIEIWVPREANAS